ncbi:nucleoside permease [Opitutia bacterium ISCC 51]|nr:nucleoside permease [Opitutae bacterium ISCC 51]QXD29901.1 nucleoside permease [Opitutae bacterium ISCC 52]
MTLTTRSQLSALMFVQFFIWGCWYAFIGAYISAIGFTPGQQGAVFSTVALGGIISPFFIGMIADRFFSAQRVLAVLHLVGGILLWIVAGVTDPTTFYWILLAHTICFMPTLALVNTISFHQMTDTGKEFPGIRVLGTIGWIAAGILIGTLDMEVSANIFKIAAVVSIALAIYSLFLPNTPPQAKGKSVSIRDVLGLDSLVLLKDRSYAVFIVSSLLICIPLTFYYGQTSAFMEELAIKNTGTKMTFGQMSEIFFLLVMPFFFVRLGIKKMLLIGMLAWTIRYVLFAYADAGSMVWMLYAGIILHGICFDFFFVSGQIYVDKCAPEEIRASAQGFISFVTYGVGMFIGSYVMGAALQSSTLEIGGIDWKKFWFIPAVMALVVMIFFALVFKEPKASEEEASA